MKKKVLAMALCAVLAVSAFAGCGQQTAAKSSAAATGSSAGITAMKAIDKDKIKVGVVHISDPAEGSGYTYTHDVGIVAMQKELGLADNQIVRKNNVADSDQKATETAMRDLIDEGCNVIFATSFN